MRLKPVLTSKYILQKRCSLIEICMSKPANDILSGLGLIIRKVSVSAAVTVRINVKNTALLDFVLSNVLIIKVFILFVKLKGV